MRRFLVTAILGSILATGLWALYHQDQIHNLRDAIELVSKQFGDSILSGSEGDLPNKGVPSHFASWSQQSGPDRIRMATFNIQTLGQSKAASPDVVQRIVEILRQFDVVAIQEIRNADQTVLPLIVTQLQSVTGRPYACQISGPQGRSEQYREQSGFIFDQSKVRLDDSIVYDVRDPQDSMIRPPFVGWFRAAAPRPDQSFTFSLVNVHIDSRNPAAELAFLRELFLAVRKDGRGEDDVIILGDFNAGDKLLKSATQHSGLVWAVSESFTNTRGTSQYDNIVFESMATSEYLSNSGVFDFLKHLNLSLDEALEISDHLPVWAEFSIFEGGTSGMTVRSAEELSREFFNR